MKSVQIEFCKLFVIFLHMYSEINQQNNELLQGWPTFHLPCNGFRCATISINLGASIFLPCRVCLQKQRFVRGCKLRVITTRLQCATSNHAMRHSLATPELLSNLSEDRELLKFRNFTFYRVTRIKELEI